MAWNLTDGDIYELITDVEPISEPDRVFFGSNKESEASPSARLRNFIEEDQDGLSDVPSEHSAHDTDSEIGFSTDEPSTSSESEDAEETNVSSSSQAGDKTN